MLIKLGISCIVAIVTTTGFANNEPGGLFFSAADTVDIQNKDSFQHENFQPRDPKQDFKDLFATGSETNGIDIARLNPLAINFVEDYIDSHSKMLENLKDRARPYFDKIDAILVKHGLPKELKYLAVIESQLKSNARSWAGAVGPWQLMPATGRNLGLKINKSVDERRDITKSTHAASKYITSLYAMYGDWLLVIAAYNGGPGKVNSAIKRSGSRDFWTLQKYLPAESRKHVKKFIATHYIMEGEGGITTLTKKETAHFLLAAKQPIVTEPSDNTVIKTINGRYNAAVIAKHVDIAIADFHKNNPDFDNLVAAAGKYELRLPADKMDIFMSKKIEILKESIQLLLNPDAQIARSL